MAHTSQCHCRVSTPTLWRKLHYVGLSPNPAQRHLAAGKDVILSVSDGFFQTVPESEIPEESVDCGSNDDLFVAIAALDDATDLHQWFVYNDGEEERWFRCNQDDVTDAMWEDGKYRFCHKADVNEILYHFNYEM